MAITILGAGIKNNTSNTLTTLVTGNINTTGASLIVVGISYLPSGTTPPTLTSIPSNSWILVKRVITSSDHGLDLYYCSNPSTSSTHTFSLAGTATWLSLAVQAFGGTLTSSTPLDVNNGSITNTVNSSYSSGSVTTTSSPEIAVGIATFSSTPISATPPTGYTYSNNGTGSTYSLALAYKQLSSTSTENPTFSTTSGSNSPAVIVATFKAAPPPVTNGNFLMFF